MIVGNNQLMRSNRVNNPEFIIDSLKVWGNASAVIATYPVGIITGDLIVLSLFTGYNGNSASWSDISRVPSGFTYISHSYYYRFAYAVYYKVADGTESETTLNCASNYDLSATIRYASISIIRGANNISPIGNIGTIMKDTAGSISHTINGVIGNISDMGFVVYAGKDYAQIPFTDTTINWISIREYGDNATNACVMYIGYKLYSSESSEDFTITSSSSEQGTGVQFRIKV